MLLSRNFDYFGGYLVVTARYLVVIARSCSLLVVTACYGSLLLVPTFSMNAHILDIKFLLVVNESCTKTL